MFQRRFWGKRATFKLRKRQIKLSARGVYEPVQLEEDVLQEIMQRLWYSGIPVFREKERIPRCPHCGLYVASAKSATDRGHPDLHGYIPARLSVTGVAVPFYIEVKRPQGGVRSYEQEEFIRRAQAAGVLAFFANSWAVVKEQFESRTSLLRAA